MRIKTSENYRGGGYSPTKQASRGFTRNVWRTGRRCHRKPETLMIKCRHGLRNMSALYRKILSDMPISVVTKPRKKRLRNIVLLQFWRKAVMLHE